MPQPFSGASSPSSPSPPALCARSSWRLTQLKSTLRSVLDPSLASAVVVIVNVVLRRPTVLFFRAGRVQERADGCEARRCLCVNCDVGHSVTCFEQEDIVSSTSATLVLSKEANACSARGGYLKSSLRPIITQGAASCRFLLSWSLVALSSSVLPHANSCRTLTFLLAFLLLRL